MTTRMLIDARHHEETRVAVLNGSRIEEFDFESADHKQIKGNIYLAKVTRVEPSLQAAFVDYGGNRHGFLAFSEIHPDYYQIPKADRDALLAEEAAHAAEEEALRAAEDDEDDYADERGDDHHDDYADEDRQADDESRDDRSNGDDDNGDFDDQVIDAEPLNGDDSDGDDDAGEAQDDNAERGNDRRGRNGRGRRGKAKGSDELRQKRMALRRRYKIQDVIHRRQVLLVQVVKEERGNKGAALTTYLSLAGRYCVLMPNSTHGGGISRKISNASDRKRLKSIISEMALPKSMGCIVRTAGLQRTKTEIRRDFDYLARLWDEIRETTMGSAAPALIHSDSDLIKRAIRDIYNREIEEVLVEGGDGYRAARDFMKLLMPSHARRVRQYADPVPLFQRFGAEDQLSAMYDPVVQLRSGGYLVINPTEALVSIDINSGRSTKEHGIEATALNTNLEAAREIARQLRLRDMAGLVVIDFIDMEYSNNIRKVEKAMREALKNDRARIQVGRISGFGLMEMSRQRLRTGVLEATTRACPHCEGTGLVRTASSAGLSALRMLEDEAAKGRGTLLTLQASQEAAIYVLNQKRRDIAEIEERYGVFVEILPDGENEGARMTVTASGPRPTVVPQFAPIEEPEADDLDEEFVDEFDEEEEAEARPSRDRAPRQREGGEGEGEDGQQGRKRRKRRRGRRSRRDADGNVIEQTEAEAAAEDAADAAEAGEQVETDGTDGVEGEMANGDAANGEARGKSRRGRRGGRNRSRRDDRSEASQSAEAEGDDFVATNAGADEAVAEPEVVAEDAPAKPKRRTRKTKAEREAEAEAGADDAATKATPAAEDADAEPAPKPRRSRARKTAEPAEVSAEAAPVAEEAPAKPKRSRAKKVAAPEDAAESTAAEPVAEAPAPAPEAPAAETSAADAPAADAPAADAAPAETQDDGPPRRGWWQRTFGA